MRFSDPEKQPKVRAFLSCINGAMAFTSLGGVPVQIWADVRVSKGQYFYPKVYWEDAAGNWGIVTGEAARDVCRVLEQSYAWRAWTAYRVQADSPRPPKARAEVV